MTPYPGSGKKPQASHVDDWLMTYADMITLLLCFFVILLIVSVSKRHTQQIEPVQQVVEATLHQPQIQPAAVPLPVPAQVNVPDVFQGNLPFHAIDQADTNETAEDPAPVADPAQQDAPPAPKTDVALPQTPIPPATLSDIADHLNTPAPANATDAAQGDRIKIFEVNSAAFFDSGSATLSKSGMAILRKVAVDLKSDQLKDYQITVEGYTDDTPIHTLQFPSNWELSTGRASAVVHFFLDQGLPAERLRAAGYADTFPKAPNRDANGDAIPANQAQNRRVVIKLEKIEKN